MDILLETAIRAALDAGREILAVYETDFGVEKKSDDSPLTLADKRAHEIIKAALKPLGLPLLSEEGRAIPFEVRRQWPRFWLVDPLDGTKEFIRRNGEFTVNIALIEANRPTMGVVYVPVRDRLYFAREDIGSYKLDQAMQLYAKRTEPVTKKELIEAAMPLPLTDVRRSIFTVVGSRSHATPDLEKYIDQLRTAHDPLDFVSAGSSLKFCLVAEGQADIYPRLGPTMEWDTGAGQVVAQCAGARVVAHATGKELGYNKASLLNPWFIVERKK
ncbi:MAG: 3'(2'),5'-bisphosphate nucleotidase CysQ [Desulfatitalea sp.]|nr:3'(2'),5'-bisphosphate nucleotidase CysQ [Desulfatitalea sp.]